MKLRGLRLAAWSLLAFAAACAQMARAHEFKLDAVLNAVKTSAGRGPARRPRAAGLVQVGRKFPISNNNPNRCRQAGACDRAIISPR